MTSEKSLTDMIDAVAPDFYKMTYYKNLFEGEFTKEQTMKAQLQDFARSIGCQGLREIQLKKLNDAVRLGIINHVDGNELRETILDELSSPSKKSHYEIRLQIFENSGYSESTLKKVIPLVDAENATKIFRNIFEQHNLLEITAAVGAIEKWYFPLASKLEKCYLKLGYTQSQVETYTLHKQADQEHSRVCYKFIEKYSMLSEKDVILSAVTEGFRSVILYDDARYTAASGNMSFQNKLS